MTEVERIARRMGEGLDLRPAGLVLDLDGFALRVRSNSEALIARLRDYFGHVASEKADVDLDLIAYERPALDLGLDFIDWRRERGKTGRKDAYADLPGARVVLKVRTAMVFLQSRDHVVAAGPCLENDNQVINFINAEYMNWLQQRGWMICHAAGLVRRGHALGLAGFSGGGKSTLMLHMLENDDVSFLSNDRLFVRQNTDAAAAAGIPKLPRINPGTVVHNPRLHDLIEPGRRRELLAMDREDLWDLEEKYDVNVTRLYGEGRIVHRARLKSFLILNWSRDGERDWAVEEVDMSGRRDLLAAVMKSPGPFYQKEDGSLFADGAPFDEDAYLAALHGISFFEVTGRVDFDGVARHCLEHLI